MLSSFITIINAQIEYSVNFDLQKVSPDYRNQLTSLLTNPFKSTFSLEFSETKKSCQLENSNASVNGEIHFVVQSQIKTNLSTGGRTIFCKADWYYWSIQNNSNTVEIQFSYRKSNENWSAWQKLPPGEEVHIGRFEATGNDITYFRIKYSSGLWLFGSSPFNLGAKMWITLSNQPI